MSTARPRSCARSRIISTMVRPVWESSAVVGLSARMISGSPASARANRTIRIEDGMIDESAPEMAVPVELLVQNKAHGVHNLLQ